MLDITKRVSNKAERIEDDVKEFSISQLVRAGMKDYTKALTEFTQSQSNLKVKRIIQGMYEGDEATLALIVLRSVITYLITQQGTCMLSTLTSIISKSMLDSKTMAQLESEHQALNNYIDKAYKRVKESKRIKAKMKSSLNLVGEIKEAVHLDEDNGNAYSVGGILLTILVETIDIVQIIKLDSKCRNQGRHFSEYAPLSYLVEWTEDTRYALVDLDFTAREFITPVVTPQLEAPKKVIRWDAKDSDLLGSGRPRTLIKMPKKKQNLKEFKFVMDKEETHAEYKQIHSMIEATEWTINNDIADVMNTVFNENIVDKELTLYKGEHFEFHPELVGGLPRRYSLETEKLIDKTKLGRTTITDKGFIMFDDDSKGLNRYNQVKNDLLAFNEANLNKALSLQSKLGVAEEYKHKAFWFTYQYDTRSRIYPVQTGLNPQSDKKGKALLKFNGKHGAKKLATRGHYWAKVHGANTWGLDKAELDDRVALIDGMIADGTLVKVGETPLMFLDLWTKVDDPYGFLAFAIEYCKVLRDPEYPYAISTALDATCSGIQIYSGLLLDRKGGEAVNVVGQTRQDIYGKVATVANRMLAEGDYERFSDFTNGNDEVSTVDYLPIARSLAGKINRNISKRNTMTQPYSVTMKGMQEQLKETFKELEDKGEKFWVGEIWQVSKLLADIHQRAIDEVVEGAKRGKDFIKEITAWCASRNKGLLYTTKLGFPVYQKNVKSKTCQVQAHIWTPDRGTQRVQYRVKKKVARVNTHSQKNSSAPNLIHSLDSTLLQMTVKKCWMKGVRSFHLIHDSYGVHPNDCDILCEAVREAFVELFSEDVLYEWAIEVLTNAGFSEDEMAEIFTNIDDPMINTLDLNEVFDAVFMFS